MSTARAVALVFVYATMFLFLLAVAAGVVSVLLSPANPSGGDW